MTSPDPRARSWPGTATAPTSATPNTVPERAIAYRQEFGLAADYPVPVDAVTASGSGPRPRHLHRQRRPAGARRWPGPAACPLSTVLAQVKAHTTGRSLGVLGDPGVNVLTLNLALDNLSAH